LETTKAAFDIEAEAAGHIIHMVPVGADVKVGARIALIGSDLEALRAEQHRSAAKAEPSGGGSKPVRATRKAISLAQELGIDLAHLDVDGIISEADVRQFAGRGVEGKRVGREAWIRPPNADERGFVAPEFLARIEEDSAFGGLSSDLKVCLYRTYGAIIGDGVKIGAGTIIRCRLIRLGDRVEIGRDCIIKTDRFVMGTMSVIGDRARIATREVEMGEVCFSGDDILIGGGGALGPRSRLKVGDNCLISSRCVLNTGEPIVLGDEVGLSPNVQLYTHSHWQNVLRGYSARHAGIEVESGAYITANSLLVPGVRIGEGATVLANSVVSADVEPYTIVSGVPARKVGEINTNLTVAQKDHLVRRMMTDLADLLEFQGFEPSRLVYLRAYDSGASSDVDVVLALDVPPLPEGFERPVVFDLTSLRVYGVQTRVSDEVRNFLRRRGMRFRPSHWRYQHDRESEPHQT
jgi:acetyltransferase-like isoleucine patch superfamily enzyme